MWVLVCFSKSPWKRKLNLLISSMNKLYLIKDLLESIWTLISLSDVLSVTKGGSSETLLPGRAFDFVIFNIFLQKGGNSISQSTGGPSSSCEMIMLRNKSYGEIIRVCLGIFTSALRNKKKHNQILNKNTSPHFDNESLAIWPLIMLKRNHFSELSISRFTTYIRIESFHINWNGSSTFWTQSPTVGRECVLVCFCKSPWEPKLNL